MRTGGRRATKQEEVIAVREPQRSIGRGVGRVGVFALTLWAGAAAAQPVPGGTAAYDVNAVRPGVRGAEPGAERAGSPVVGRARAGEQGEQGPFYRVSRFLIEYRQEHPQAPSAEDILTAPVRLGVSSEGYVSPVAGVPTTTIRLRDVADGASASFSAAALTAISRGVVEALQREGLASLIVQLHPQDINIETGEDLRPTKDGDLRLLVWAGQIADVRSIAAGQRLEGRIGRQELDRVNPDERVHNRVRRMSPVVPGELVNKPAIDDYLYRLNRHPGRRVDVGVGPGEREGEVALDYVVNESKPWSVYLQLSNTGTEATSEWRQRFGFVHNQLTSRDDIFRVDYITGNFSESHALLGSYDFPILSDKLRARVAGGYSEYDASEVGLGNERFTGQNYTLSGELAWNFFQRRQLFLDLAGGVRWQSVRVENSAFGVSGTVDYVAPYAAVRAERVTDVSQFFASIGVEVQDDGLSGIDGSALPNLGRPNPSESWQVLKWDASQSFYIEPLISDAFWGRGEGGPTTLAHEIYVGARGQYAFNNRLIPTEQDVVGGMFTVRGYPESFVAGDNIFVATLEYRFHVPQAFPVSATGKVGDRPMRLAKLLGEDFRFAPQEPFGRADWDLILKGFLDVGNVESVSPVPGERNETLMGAGVGMEFQYKRNLTLRLDLGFALEDVTRPGDSVEAGDNRVNFLLTLMY